MQRWHTDGLFSPPGTTKPAAEAKINLSFARSFGDLRVCLTLVVVSILIRLPILELFDLVTIDGISYINQAKALMRGTVAGGAFPIGYPAFIGVFLPIITDGVRAAQVVSFIAGLGAVIAFYFLAKQFLKSGQAFFCALVFAVHPLFMRLSLMTSSESLYVMWVCLGLLFFALNRDLLFGLAMGLAAITRPEAIAILVILALLRLRQPRRLLIPVVVFAILYSLNSAYLSGAAGRFVLLPQRELFEASVPGYAARLPIELGGLHRNILPALLFLALFGIYSRPGFLLAALAPLVFIPAFAIGSGLEYLLPYVSIVILYGFIGADAIRHDRWIAWALIVLSVLANPLVNRRHLTEPVSAGYAGSKKAGLQFRDRLQARDKIADARPFVAFYAGDDHVEIPVAPYEEAMRSLTEENVTLLSLHRVTAHEYPALEPLLYDRAAIKGEVRLTQIFYDPGGEVIYERVRDADPLTWRRLTDLEGTTQSPCWSPDGKRIAFRLTDVEDRSAICIATADGSAVRRVADVRGGDDPMTWSPDGGRIAYAASTDGGMDIFILDINRPRPSRVTTDDGADTSPSWSRNGREIAFRSNRTGSDEIWIKDLESGRLSQLTEGGGNRFPVFSNLGDRIAWVSNTDVVILDRDTGMRAYARGNITYRPTWSPNDRYIVFEAEALGSRVIYIVLANAAGRMLLTRPPHETGMPTWNPRGNQIAVTSNRDGKSRVFVLSGLEDYMKRLEHPPPAKTFPREQ